MQTPTKQQLWSTFKAWMRLIPTDEQFRAMCEACSERGQRIFRAAIAARDRFCSPLPPFPRIPLFIVADIVIYTPTIILASTFLTFYFFGLLTYTFIASLPESEILLSFFFCFGVLLGVFAALIYLIVVYEDRLAQFSSQVFWSGISLILVPYSLFCNLIASVSACISNLAAAYYRTCAASPICFLVALAVSLAVTTKISSHVEQRRLLRLNANKTNN
ncbi:hypothetical protein FQN49_008725 [Arthroderma sp. PD_2]|nr:hypothetical protein FQN49_008725 [Arthroderma sp. PD_2]